MLHHTADQVGTEVLGAAAYAALAELERVGALAVLAPRLADRMAVADAAAARYGSYRSRLDRLGGSEGTTAAMTQGAAAVDDARRRTEPGDWWEGLAAVSLCAPLNDELFGAVLSEVQLGDPPEGDEAGGDGPEDKGLEDRSPGNDAVGTPGSASATIEWATARLREAAAADPVLAARLALWSRRLVGEAIVLAREFGGERYPELAEELAARHTGRLVELGFED